MKANFSMMLIAILIALSQTSAQKTPTTAATPAAVTSAVTPAGETKPNSVQCLTPAGKSGMCINLHQCIPLFNILKQEPLLEENKLYLRSSQCGLKNDTVLVCCPTEQATTTVAPSVVA